MNFLHALEKSLNLNQNPRFWLSQPKKTLPTTEPADLPSHSEQSLFDALPEHGEQKSPPEPIWTPEVFLFGN